MPNYEYSCSSCNKSTEVNRKFDEKEIIPPCPSCGYKMTRSYGAVGVQFKGSGFYKTDNPK